MKTKETDMLELRSRIASDSIRRSSSIVPEYMPLLQSVFLSPEDHPAHGGVVAFTATDDKGDVSPVVKALAEQLAGLSSKSILIADVMALQRLRNSDAVDAPRICRIEELSSVWLLTDKDELCDEREDADLLFDRLWEHNTNYGPNPLQQLRQDFDFILIECYELQHIAIVAPLVDGVVVVAASNRTRRGEVNRALQLIEVTGGKLLGFVLNRHRSPLPSWLSRWL